MLVVRLPSRRLARLWKLFLFVAVIVGVVVLATVDFLESTQQVNKMRYRFAVVGNLLSALGTVNGGSTLEVRALSTVQ